jgi:hypothetical protein
VAVEVGGSAILETALDDEAGAMVGDTVAVALDAAPASRQPASPMASNPSATSFTPVATRHRYADSVGMPRLLGRF